MSLIEFKKYNSDLSGVHFCIRALDLSDTRPHVSHILISSGFMYGTDGRRLHRFKLANTYKPGLYLVAKKIKNHIILVKTKLTKSKTYPSTLKLFKHKIKKSFEASCSSYRYIHAVTKIIRAQPDNFSINPDMIKDIEDSCCTIYVGDLKIVIEVGNKTAVLMPYKA